MNPDYSNEDAQCDAGAGTPYYVQCLCNEEQGDSLCEKVRAEKHGAIEAKLEPDGR